MEDSVRRSSSGSQSLTRFEQPDTTPSTSNQLVPMVTSDPSIVSLLDDAAQTYQLLDPADTDHVEWLQAYSALTTDEKLDALCDKLKLDDQSATQLKSAYKDICGWLDPKTLSPQEKEAIEKLDAAYQDMLDKAAPANVSKGALAWHAFKVGCLSSAFGFAMVTAITKIATAAMGPAGLHFLNLGGPSILLLGEVAGGKLRARGASYAPVDSQAYMTHDRLERQFEANRSEAWAVKHRRDTASTPEEASRWQARLDDLKASGDKLRVVQQCNFVDMLHREWGHELKTKKAKDPADAPSWSTRLFCCSKVEAASDGTVSCGGGELFKIKLPVTKESAVVVWLPDGMETNLAKQRVPKAYEERFREAQYSLMVSATLRAMVSDELQFWPLVAFYTFTPPAGMVMAAKHLPNAAWWDMMVTTMGSFFGMLGTVQMHNVARSYLSGAPVVTPRDQLIQDRLHDLNDLKEDIMDTRVDLCEQIDSLVETELKETQAKLAPIQEGIEERVFFLAEQNGISREEMRAYADARQKARHNGTEVDDKQFPGIVKLKELVNADQATRAMHAKDNKDYLSAKVDQLTRLRVALRQQRAGLVEAREKAKHDRRAAHSDKLASFGTAVSDSWKDFGHNLSNFFARTLTYEAPFTFYAEVFTGLGTMMMASAAMSAQSAGMDAGGFNTTANATATADPYGSGMSAAIGTSALSGMVFLAFVSQRNKTLLWPLQKVLYGGYGLAKAFKALVWDLPPPVIAAEARPARTSEDLPQDPPETSPKKKLSASEGDSGARDIYSDVPRTKPDTVITLPSGVRDPDSDSSSDTEDEQPQVLPPVGGNVVTRVLDSLI